MANTLESRSEKYLRFSRRGMTVTLLLVLAIGGFCLAMAVQPHAPVWSRAMPVLWIVAVVIVVGLQRTLGGERWNTRAPEARAIMEDEWRRSNMERARRVAFVVVLGAQLPLGLLLTRLPSLQAVMAMATATITLGLATLIALFLHFDRDVPDAG
jgi:FtsH-binding integral membrane protein